MEKPFVDNSTDKAEIATEPGIAEAVEAGPSVGMRLAAITTLKTGAKIELVGGVLGGIAAAEETPLGSVGAPVVVLGLVTLTEYLQTEWGKNKAASHSYLPTRRYSPLNDAVACLAASGQGAGPNLAYNEAVGLPNSKRRRFAQSMAYAGGVSLWSTEVPPWRYGGHAVKAGAEASIEHPLPAAAVIAAGSVAYLGATEAVRAIRNKMAAKKRAASTKVTTTE